LSYLSLLNITYVRFLRKVSVFCNSKELTNPNSCITLSSCLRSSWPFSKNIYSWPLLPVNEKQMADDQNLHIQKSITVNQLIFAAIMFHVFLLQDSFAITKMLKVQIFRGMTLVYITANIGCFFITRVVFHNILLIVWMTYPIDFVNTFY
jgi:hypothetical protein